VSAQPGCVAGHVYEKHSLGAIALVERWESEAALQAHRSTREEHLSMKATSEIARYLKANLGLFAGFADERLVELVGGSRVRSFEANEAIIHYGEEVAHFGVVLDGTAMASVLGPGGTRQTVGRVEAGGTFGEMALMTGDKMLADIVAESRCEVLLIPVSLFQSVIVAEPGAVQYISRTIAERFKLLIADPSTATAALLQSPDPYGLQLKGERAEKILVINCGSSSLKYSFYDTADDARHARGLVERIGITGTRHVYHGPKGDVTRELPQGGFAEAFKAMLGELAAKDTGVIGGTGEVSVVAHRVVHGGERFTEATLDFFDRLSAAKLTVIEDVYKSEAATNQRNRAHAYILAASERIYSDPMDAVDVYTRQCSIGVTAKQLGVMGATLANGGVNPVTGGRVIDAKHVPKVLAIMMMAGFYNESGMWAYSAGLPGKTGVGGGIVAVVPGKMAIVGFSPRLNEAGNSIRSTKAIEYITDQLGANLFGSGR
jgi:CRP-like cAMP-binding protein